MKDKKLIICLLSIIFSINSFGQCKEPFVPSFSERSTSSIKVSWLDNNTAPIGYQIAHAEKGVNIQNAYVSETLSVKNKSLTSLNSGTAYNFWLRTICSINDTSKWVGPYAFTTYITNPSPCEMKIDIKDNSCNNNTGDVFNIEVNLGQNTNNHVLESVSLIIQHTWPADLKVELESPWGESISLTQFNGTVSDNFGGINEDCNNPAIFSDEACENIKEGNPPFIGNFVPEEPLSTFNTSTNKNGLWKLKICDDAFNDRGVLKYVKLHFAEFSCFYVSDYYVSRVSNKSYTITWSKPDNCLNMQVFYRKKGDLLFDNRVVNCDSLKVRIDNLDEGNEYEFYMVSNCGGTNLSSPSCLSNVNTLCSNTKLYENFDSYSVCEPSCAVPCEIESFFTNIKNDDADWIVFRDETPTEFTGPNTGAFDGGSYIYIESNPIVCDTISTVVLESKCLKSNSVSSSCDLNFFYHMYGSDIAELEIQKSVDGKSWSEINKLAGEKGNDWLSANISLNENLDSYFRIRFIGKTKNGNQGDIGLDEISITNSIVTENLIYYFDQDGDGYGDNDSIILLCSKIAPNNYTLLNGDCNDKNPEVNPSETDVPCNLVDENCDGIIELENISNPIVVSNVEIKNISCAGKSDGSISIEVSGGTPPYSYLWNNNEVLQDISDIQDGKFFATITDVNGCGLVTDTFYVGIVSQYDITVESIIDPSCFGKSDGSISINHTSLFPPFIYNWSNGSTSKNLSSIPDGSYRLSITDVIGCIEISDIITIISEENFNALTSLKRNPFCFGLTTGVLEVQGINGSAPYQYLWSDGHTGNRKQNLPSGNYTITITDNSGCEVLHEDSIVEPKVLDIKLLNVEPARCNGNKTGVIKTITTGGTPPYNYVWHDGGPPLETRNNLAAGIYSVTVSDSNGCSDSQNTIFVFQPPPLIYTIDSIVNSSCLAKDDGQIFVTVSGGIMPFEFYWNSEVETSEDSDSLLPGTYTLTVLDANRCKLTTESIDVLSFNTSALSTIEVLNKNICPNEKKGSIKVSIESNATPFDFNWSNGTQRNKSIISDTIFGLESGTYKVTITDNNGCVTISNNAKIDNITEFNPTINVINNICKEDSLGEIKVTMSGATPPYTYEWNNGSNTNIIDDLKNGIYSFLLKDKNNCEYQSQSINLSSSSNLTCDIFTIDTESGLSNGSCIISPIGGIGNYIIDWENNQLSGFSIQNLDAGTYNFTLKDNLNCEIDSFVVIDIINKTNDIRKNKTSIFPNPTNGTIQIVGLENEESKIQIFNTHGTKVLETYFVKKNKMDLSHLESGLYLVVVRINDRIEIHKIVIN